MYTCVPRYCYESVRPSVTLSVWSVRNVVITGLYLDSPKVISWINSVIPPLLQDPKIVRKFEGYNFAKFGGELGWGR